MTSEQPNDKKRCYFIVCLNGTGAKCIRFGLSRRREAQIVSSQEAWRRVRKYLVADGYEVIEVTEEGPPAERCVVA